MRKGKRLYLIIALLAIVFIIAPIFGFALTVLRSLGCALGHGAP
jgi:hypothetical protein